VDIGAIGNDPALEDEFADPQVKQLQQQVAQLTGFIQNQQTQQQSYEQASTQSFIDQFAQKPMQVGTRRTRTLKQCDLSWGHSLAAATQLT
jgi:hypothetical protein